MKFPNVCFSPELPRKNFGASLLDVVRLRPPWAKVCRDPSNTKGQSVKSSYICFLSR